jgi:hypothetical protein
MELSRGVGKNDARYSWAALRKKKRGRGLEVRVVFWHIVIMMSIIAYGIYPVRNGFNEMKISCWREECLTLQHHMFSCVNTVRTCSFIALMLS